MFRKLAATVVATVLAFALFPALSASAAVAGTASITAGKDGLPGMRDMSVQVRSTTQQIIGDQVTRVDIILPPAFSQAQCPATPVGTWTCRVVTITGGAQTLVFEVGPLSGAGSVTFPFKAMATRPANNDSVGRVKVFLQSAPGAEMVEAVPTGVGALDAAIRILEVVPALMGATAPAGVVDGTGTASQQGLTYCAAVRNHARNLVPITVSMSSNGNETFSGPATQSATGLGATTTYCFGLDLGTVPSGSSAGRNFTATASAPNSQNATGAKSFTVETAPLLNLLQNTFSHPVISTDDGLGYTFSIDANKQHFPGITGLSGTMTLVGSGCDPINLASPPDVARPAQNGVELTYQVFMPCAGVPDGFYDADFTFAGTDDNGKAYSQAMSLTDLIEIDNLAPILDLADIDPPSGQLQVTNGDSIRVTGSVNDTVARAPLTFVELQSTNGVRIPVSVTTTSTATGYTFTGTATLAGLTGDTDSLFAVAQACDRAPNCGGDTSNHLQIDTLDPFLVDPGYVVTGADYPTIGTTDPVIVITFSDRYTVRDGCDITHYRLSGSSAGNFVSQVYLSNGTPCGAGNAPVPDNGWPADNQRILRPAQPIGPESTPGVRYTPQNNPVLALEDAANDGALNLAGLKDIRTESLIAPLIPDLQTVARNAAAGHNENAPLDEGAYWTRFDGNDALLSYLGANPGYFVEVLDENGASLLVEEADGTVTIPVPADAEDGLYNRQVRFINSRGLIGDAAPLTIAVDTAAAALADATYNGTNAVTTTWSEKLWAGSNFPENWFVLQLNPDYEAGGEDAPYYGTRPNRVDGGQVNTRTLTVSLDSNPFAGVQYQFDPVQNNLVYVDRAGNQTANQALIR